MRLRTATDADVDALARMAADALAGYTAFAPAGWAPPTVEQEVEQLAVLLRDPAVWCRVAEDERGLAGQVTVLPAAQAARPVDEPELAHLRDLFLREDTWGTGLAATLVADAVAHAREQGFTAVRLFVATGQARARRFYAREGWRPEGAPFFDPKPGLELLELRRPSS